MNDRIPHILFQISISRPKDYVIDSSMRHIPGWKYIHFNDEEMLDYLNENPIDEFPDILNVFHSFDNGAHRADLFRYVYLFQNGGVYLDSDAVLECNIEGIIEGASFATIKGYHEDNPLAFNGFLVAEKESPIMLEALKRAYTISPQKLISDYHAICKDLLNIVESDISSNVRLFNEVKNDSFYAGVKSYTDSGMCILTHYCYVKEVPRINFWSKPIFNLLFSRVKAFKFYKSYME